MNRLRKDKKLRVLSCLCEGMGIRPTERATGVSRNTIMKVLVEVGEGCDRLHDRMMQGLTLDAVELDEQWSFVWCKERHIPEGTPNKEIGEQWTFVLIDRTTKLVPCYAVGKRSIAVARQILLDLQRRTTTPRLQICTDGWKEYPVAVEEIFGLDIDFGVITKTLAGGQWDETKRKYAPTRVKEVYRHAPIGFPGDIGTSYIERLNHSSRMHNRRLTRLVNGFSKKLRNHKAAVALWFAYYNFVLIHKALKVTPAMEARVVNRLWDLEDLLDAVERLGMESTAA